MLPPRSGSPFRKASRTLPREFDGVGHRLVAGKVSMPTRWYPGGQEVALKEAFRFLIASVPLALQTT